MSKTNEMRNFEAGYAAGEAGSTGRDNPHKPGWAADWWEAGRLQAKADAEAERRQTGKDRRDKYVSITAFLVTFAVILVAVFGGYLGSLL